jgi:hypothetical protein
MLVAAATTNLAPVALAALAKAWRVGLGRVAREGLVLELEHGAGAVGGERGRDRVDAVAREGDVEATADDLRELAGRGDGAQGGSGQLAAVLLGENENGCVILRFSSDDLGFAGQLFDELVDRLHLHAGLAGGRGLEPDGLDLQGKIHAERRTPSSLRAASSWPS